MSSGAHRPAEPEPRRPRRPNGEVGTAFFDQRRQRWEVRVGFRDTAGRYATADGGGTYRRLKGVGATEAQAVADAQAKLARALRGVDPELAAMTVAEFIPWWLDRTQRLRPGTVENYRQIAASYITPHIGHLKVRNLRPAHVEGMQLAIAATKSERTKRPLSANTQRLARAVLRRALNEAMRREIVDRNVATAAYVDGVNVPRPEGRSLTQDEAKSLLAACAGHRLEVPIVLMLGVGLRRGEALGLRWADIELTEGEETVTIRRALKVEDGRLILSEPKTRSSLRTVGLPKELAAILARWKKSQARERAVAGKAWSKDWPGLVCTTSVGTPIDPANLRHGLARMAKTAKLGHWHPHELRHSAASLLLAMGVPLKEVSATLGHSGIAITADTYAHLLGPERRRVADGMSAALWS